MKKCTPTDCNGACKAAGKPCPFERLNEVLFKPAPLDEYINKPDQGNSPAVIVFALVAWVAIFVGIILIVRTLSGTL